VIAMAADHYDIETLADLYNRARVDYIVPMPMNGRRLADYVLHYDVDLTMSAVALNDDNEECGLIMTGVRDPRSWATRLGVIPERRGHHIGQFLMEYLLAQSRDHDLRYAQLEVIKGNSPAIALFTKLGFTPTRELLVIRRAPGKLVPRSEFDSATVSAIAPQDIPGVLACRAADAAWTEETSSLLKAGSLNGLQIELPSGEAGWIVFQVLPFQLTHFVLSPYASDGLIRALLYHVHRRFALQDTKVENLPLGPAWTAFQSLGYVEAFRRIEMILPL